MSDELEANFSNRNPQLALRNMLERYKPAIASVLPRHITADRMVKVLLSATARKPDLLKCTYASICHALMQASELGLELGGILGEAYLVPYNVKIKEKGHADRWEKHAQMIPGYRGLIKLARQSGDVRTIAAHVTYENDVFSVNLADEQIRHIPNLRGERDDRNIIAVYAIAKFKTGERLIDFMTRAEVEKVRRRSKSADEGPWVTDYAEMTRKTVVRRLCKYLPLSRELQAALEIDAEAEDGERLSPDILAPPEEETPKARKLAERVRSRAGLSVEAPDPIENPDVIQDEVASDIQTHQE